MVRVKIMKKDSADNKKISELEKSVEDWKAKYIRALADYQNLEKRVREARTDDIRFAAKNILLKLLPIVDVLEKAEKVLKDQGLALALGQLHNILTSESVVKMKVLGEEYDPYRMECIELVQGKNENKAAEVVQEGYTLFDKVLRAARVKVEKALSSEISEVKKKL